MRWLLRLRIRARLSRGEAADALKGDKVDTGDAIRERQMTVDIDLPEVGADEYHLFERDQTPQNARRCTKSGNPRPDSARFES